MISAIYPECVRPGQYCSERQDLVARPATTTKGGNS